MKLKGSVIAAFIVATTLTPAQAAPVYLFPIADCEANYARAHQIFAAVGQEIPK